MVVCEGICVVLPVLLLLLLLCVVHALPLHGVFASQLLVCHGLGKSCACMGGLGCRCCWLSTSASGGLFVTVYVSLLLL